jgi:hypothetical protein
MTAPDSIPTDVRDAPQMTYGATLAREMRPEEAYAVISRLEPGKQIIGELEVIVMPSPSGRREVHLIRDDDLSIKDTVEALHIAEQRIRTIYGIDAVLAPPKADEEALRGAADSIIDLIRDIKLKEDAKYVGFTWTREQAVDALVDMLRGIR